MSEVVDDVVICSDNEEIEKKPTAKSVKLRGNILKILKNVENIFCTLFYTKIVQDYESEKRF